MGDRGHERLREASHLLGQPCLQRLLAELGAFDGEGDLVGEEQQRLAFVLSSRLAGEDEKPDRTPGRGEREDEKAATLE